MIITIYIYNDSYNNIITIYTNSVALCHLMVSLRRDFPRHEALFKENEELDANGHSARSARGGRRGIHRYPLVNVYMAVCQNQGYPCSSHQNSW